MPRLNHKNSFILHDNVNFHFSRDQHTAHICTQYKKRQINICANVDHVTKFENISSLLPILCYFTQLNIIYNLLFTIYYLQFTFSLIAVTQNYENEYENPDSPIHHSIQ